MSADLSTKPSDAPSPKQAATLVLPSERIFDFSSGRSPRYVGLSVDEATAGIDEFVASAKNFCALLDLREQNNLLGAILALTTHQSFLDGALKGLGDRSAINNIFRQLLDGHHTHSHSYSGQLPGLGLLFDYVTSTPIPENLECISEGNASLGALERLARGEDSPFSGGRGVTAGEVVNGKVHAHNLEVSVFENDQPVEARFVSGESSTIQVGGKVYYNGLPGDRGKFPTFALGEGSRIGVSIRNISASESLYLMPTINGMPFHVESLQMLSSEFFSTPLPVTQITPHMFRLDPGEQLRLDHFQVDRIDVARTTGVSRLTALDNLPERIRLAPYVAERVAGSLGELERELLGNTNIPVAYRNHLRLASEVAYVHEAMSKLHQPKKTAIEIRRPVVADGAASSDLANTMLGSIGIAVVRLEPMPVEPTYTRGFNDSHLMRGSSVEGAFRLGHAGLASVGGFGDGHATAARPNILSTDNCVHRFLGFVPMNLMSVR